MSDAIPPEAFGRLEKLIASSVGEPSYTSLGRRALIVDIERRRTRDDRIAPADQYALTVSGREQWIGAGTRTDRCER